MEAAGVRSFPGKSRLEQAHREIVDEILSRKDVLASELTFASLFLFRYLHDYCLTIIDGTAVITGAGLDGSKFCVFPFQNPGRQFVAKLLEFFPEIHFVPPGFDPGGLELTKKEEDSDYIYRTVELAAYAGKKFHSQKNQYNKFTKEHSIKVMPLPDADRNELKRLTAVWCQKNCSENMQTGCFKEVMACNEGLDKLEAFGFEGVVVSADGAVAGFAYGEPLDHSTFAEHFEKGHPDYPGVYQVVLRELSKSLAGRFEYINREQDMGVEGLRRSKLSNNPCSMLEKLILRK